MRSSTPDTGPEHECRQRRRCKARVRDEANEWHGAGVDDAGKLCRPCEQAAFAALAKLWGDYQALEVVVHEPRGRVGGEKVRGTAERKIPIPLDVDSAMNAIDDELLRWTLRITRGEALPAVTRQRVQRCVEILCANTGTLVDLPSQKVSAWMPFADGGDFSGFLILDGVDAVLRLADLHRQAEKIHGLTERKVEPLRDDYCHLCGLGSLTIELDTGIIKCRECRNCWSQTEFARLNGNPLLAA